MESSNLNNAEPLPLRKDLMDSYRKSAFFGWGVAAILLIVVIALSVFIAVRPSPLMAIDEKGQVIGQVIFDEARLRSPDEILADLKTLVRRCLTTNKQSVWEDMSICLTHMEKNLQDERLASFEETGVLQKIATFGCERVNFSFDEKFTGLTKHDRGDYFAEAMLSGSVVCADNPANLTTTSFKTKLAVTLKPKTTEKPFGVEILQYEDL